MPSIEFIAGILAIITTIVGATIKMIEIALKIRDSIDNFKRMIAMQDKTLLKELNKQEEKILSLESEILFIKNQLSLSNAPNNSENRHP